MSRKPFPEAVYHVICPGAGGENTKYPKPETCPFSRLTSANLLFALCSQLIVSTTLPKWPRPSRWRCAARASARGKLRSMIT
jgi:hypothetical protein